MRRRYSQSKKTRQCRGWSKYSDSALLDFLEAELKKAHISGRCRFYSDAITGMILREAPRRWGTGTFPSVRRCLKKAVAKAVADAELFKKEE